jgi:hypothetical protein
MPGAEMSGVSVLNQWRAWREAPLPGWKCFVGWCLATALFFGLTGFLGGPSAVDAPESIYATWAIEHGQFACAFPSASISGEPEIVPVYPLVSGAVAAAFRIRDSVPYPLRGSQLARCNETYPHLSPSPSKRALLPTLNLGYLAWLVLLAGLVAWLRSAGRGHSGWEPVAVVFVAALPPVWICVGDFFHPEDLLALGLALGALAAGRRGRWLLAGALIAGAVLSQQFAFLVAAPLLVLAPPGGRARYVSGAVVTVLAVVTPLLVVSSGSAVHALTLGSGNGPFFHTAIFGQLGLGGTPLLLVTRILPIILALAFAWWALRRFGRTLLWCPDALLSLTSICIGLRLLFDPNFFPYYLMALSVLIVLIDVQRGHIRGSLMAWLAVGALLTNVWNVSPFSWVTWGPTPQRFLPVVIAASALVVVTIGLAAHTSRWNVVLGVVVVAAAVATWKVGHNPFELRTLWIWQVALVGTGLALAAAPLRSLAPVDSDERGSLLDTAHLHRV